MVISDQALKKIKEINKKDLNKILICSMKQTGCSGFEFIVEFKEPDNNTILESHSDVIIGLNKKYENEFKDSSLDYVESKFENKFVFLNNNIKSYCGCGKSFSF
jgi:iron-sulfur cluster assembly accessory protein